MKILVIDDARHNQESALTTLQDHDVTVAGSVEEAFRALGGIGQGSLKHKWDAVLTDLWMPFPESEPYGDGSAGAFLDTVYSYGRAEDGNVGEQTPAGLVFALAASNCQVPYIGICTDTDHHTDRLNAIMDLLARGFRKASPGIYRFEARNYCLPPEEEEGEENTNVKDWGKVLADIMQGETTE
jgi:CheY-like chemotaxis protein